MRRLKELQLRVARLERQSGRLRPNISLASEITDVIWPIVEAIKEATKKMYALGIDYSNYTTLVPARAVPQFRNIERAIQSKDYDEIKRLSGIIEYELDNNWRDEHAPRFRHIMPAIQILGDLVRRDDVWGESGFRKFKMGWAKFKKAGEKSEAEYWEMMKPLSQDPLVVGGMPITFSRDRESYLARVSQDNRMTINLFQVHQLRDKRSLRAMMEHELVHVEQDITRGRGLPPSDMSDSLERRPNPSFEEHSMYDVEFYPRLNDSVNAVRELIEENGLSPRLAVKKIIGEIDLDWSEETYLTKSATQWLSVLKRRNKKKYQRAVAELTSEFL